jgi:hypothetical protein
VFDAEVAVAWCEYGTREELPNINHRKEYDAELDRLPDYRITCFFVDRRYRRKGVAAVALRGALDLIAQSSGGVVEAYPQDTEGKKISASLLYKRHPHTLRGRRLPLRPAEGQEPHGDEHNGGAGLLALAQAGLPVPIRLLAVVSGAQAYVMARPTAEISMLRPCRGARCPAAAGTVGLDDSGPSRRLSGIPEILCAARGGSTARMLSRGSAGHRGRGPRTSES